MKRQKKNESGITLVALVVSIIVMLVLAGVSLNATIGENGIVTRAQEATLKHRLASYKEEFEMNLVDERIKNGIDEELLLYAINDDVKNIVTTLEDIDVGQIAIYDSKLVFVGDIDSQEGKAAEQLGYLTMTEEDYNYMLELSIIERAVKKIEEEGSAKVGIPLGTQENGQVTIAGINYGLGWYIIGADSSTQDTEILSLGVSNSEKVLMVHTPYIVKYSTGAVQSVCGKIMYAGTDNEIWRYTFNYSGEPNGIIVANMLSGVTSDSIKTETKFGEFEPSQTYATSGTTPGTIENYYKDDYTYDPEGGLVFGPTSKILNMPVDQTKPINTKFSVNITFKCDINNAISYPNNENYGGTIFAISPLVDYYVTRMNIFKGFLKIYTFTNWQRIPGSSNSDEQIHYAYTRDGYCCFDISEYSNKYVNLQVTSEVNGKTKVYINGNLVKEFNSGNMGNLKYDYCTIGDLRPGRGFKLKEGTIYNFALYGEILTEEQIAQNWNYVKNELGINEAGDKIN